MGLTNKNNSENGEKNNFIKEANKIIEKLDGNIDTNLITNLLEKIDEEFPNDNAFFLLNILIEKYPEILNSYSNSCEKDKNETIFTEIENIKEEGEKELESLELISQNQDPEFREIIRYKTNFKDIHIKTYFQKSDFIKKLPENLKESLLKLTEGKDKNEIQEIVIKFEEIYELSKYNKILGNSFFTFVTALAGTILLKDPEFFKILSFALGGFLVSNKFYSKGFDNYSFDNENNLDDFIKTFGGIKETKFWKIKDKVKGILETIRI